MTYTEIQEKLKDKKYPKELDVGNDKLLFYYNNKSKAEEGGVFIYKVLPGTKRPERKTDLYNYLAEGRTTSFNGVPNYTMDLHRTLFDSKNKLF